MPLKALFSTENACRWETISLYNILTQKYFPKSEKAGNNAIMKLMKKRTLHKAIIIGYTVPERRRGTLV